MILSGLTLEEAEQKLKDAGAAWRVRRYMARKPYEDADSVRVVRAVDADDGVFDLVVCEFKTEVTDIPKA